MITNKRIALGIGYQHWRAEDEEIGHWCPPKHLRSGECTGLLPDYEHSLDALLEPLGVLRERGWFWGIDTYMDGRFVVTLGRWDGKVKDIERIGAELAPMLAVAVAEALEASK